MFLKRLTFEKVFRPAYGIFCMHTFYLFYC